MQAESEAHKVRLAHIRTQKQERREAFVRDQKLKAEASRRVSLGSDENDAVEVEAQQGSYFGSQSLAVPFVNKKKMTKKRTPVPLTIGTKSALPEFMGYREEIFDLSEILDCINRLESREPKLTLGKILKRRNALLGICAQTMEIMQRFKEGVLPIPPKLAKDFRDVLYHVCNLYPHMDNPLSKQIEFYGSVKDMVTILLQ